jgi:hypothetical protein
LAPVEWEEDNISEKGIYHLKSFSPVSQEP